jgi:osmotically inducible protein OsmC
MSTRTAQAVWNGNLKEGNGTMAFGGGAFNGQYSFNSRFAEGEGTNPEELIAAAHAGCFSMALSGDLEKAGFDPQHIETTANVDLETVDGKPTVTRIRLQSEATVADIDAARFAEIAEGTKQNCPISRLLMPGTEITLDARLAAV